MPRAFLNYNFYSLLPFFFTAALFLHRCPLSSPLPFIFTAASLLLLSFCHVVFCCHFVFFFILSFVFYPLSFCLLFFVLLSFFFYAPSCSTSFVVLSTSLTTCLNCRALFSSPLFIRLRQLWPFFFNLSLTRAHSSLHVSVLGRSSPLMLQRHSMFHYTVGGVHVHEVVKEKKL